MEPLKNMFTPQVVEEAAVVIEGIVDGFDTSAFLSNVFDKDWQERELKQRYQHIAEVLWTFMPTDYALSVDHLINISVELRAKTHHKSYGTFPYMFLPTCIEFYGLGDFGNSVRGLETITQLVSAEFAIRPFYVRYPNEMLLQTVTWATHESEHVRRLASEGSRPALPWGIALNQYKKDPLPLLPILESLNNDASLYVRKSVANNLNDISKTHIGLVVETAKRWKGKTEATDWVVKHGCRTLLKAGNPDIMQVFGYEAAGNYALADFNVSTEVKMGEELLFSFSLSNKTTRLVKTRIEYVMYFLRKNDQHNSKTFMISDTELDSDAELRIDKKYSFKPISTRKYYVGLHKIGIVVNGVEVAQQSFELK